MTSPWSPLPNLSIATVAISQLSVAKAALASEASSGGPLPQLALLVVTADAWSQLSVLIGDSYHKAPALMLGLVALLVLPPLAIAGFMLRRQRQSPDSTVLISRPSHRAARNDKTVRSELSAWPTEAWVETGGQKHLVGRAMLRIGREADNDICLQAKTVHRYHAVIRRSTDGEVIITDLSGPEGNGILVNGKRIGESRLKAGDVIAIGEVKLSFDARPI